MSMYRAIADKEWDSARRKAFWARVFNTLRSDSGALISFEEVSKRLKLKHAIYRGVQSVPIQQIIGSVGRYQDFTRAFLPTGNIERERWKAVAALYINPIGRGAPPVELFKVGKLYFVKDGNHRVSVARQLKLKDVEAHVWEYTTPLSDSVTSADIEAFLLEIERLEFLQQTRLDVSRPNHSILFTCPGGYTDLLCQLAHYQQALIQIDETSISFEETSAIWYDMIYETVIQKIEAEGVLAFFPNRTPADFFAWIMQHHRELKSQYGGGILLSQTVRQFKNENRPSLVNRMRRLARRLTGRSPDEPL
ncbi:MAG: hypothetical protein H6673_00540 [Anaerolineales bacterium]|nr:hypothetical protein [Anaerolineales bacterium]